MVKGMQGLAQISEIMQRHLALQQLNGFTIYLYAQPDLLSYCVSGQSHLFVAWTFATGIHSAGMLLHTSQSPACSKSLY